MRCALFKFLGPYSPQSSKFGSASLSSVLPDSSPQFPASATQPRWVTVSFVLTTTGLLCISDDGIGTPTEQRRALTLQPNARVQLTVPGEFVIFLIGSRKYFGVWRQVAVFFL